MNQSLRDIIEKQKTEIIEARAELKTQLAVMAEKDKALSEKDKIIADLIAKQQATVLTAITRPTTNVKNTIKNMQVNSLTPLVDAEMRSHIPMLTPAHIEAGAVGFARYAMEHPLKGKVMVTDAARRKLKWKNEEGNIVEDLEGVELCKKFFDVHREGSRSIIAKLMKEVDEQHTIAQESQDEELIKICDERICKLADLRRDITATIKGDTNELRHDFVKEICVVPPPVQ
jgi:hypothetical protein